MGSAAETPWEAASDVYPLVILFSSLLSRGLRCMVTEFHSAPKLLHSVDSDEFTPVRLPGATSLWPVLGQRPLMWCQHVLEASEW